MLQSHYYNVAAIAMEEEESAPTALQTVDPEVRAYVYSLVSAVCMPNSEPNAR